MFLESSPVTVDPLLPKGKLLLRALLSNYTHTKLRVWLHIQTISSVTHAMKNYGTLLFIYTLISDMLSQIAKTIGRYLLDIDPTRKCRIDV